jgi:hypothetical protein
VPFDWKFATEEELVTVRASGPTTFEQCIAVLDEIIGDPRHQKQFRVLVDAREVDYSPSIAELRQIATALAERHDSFSGRIALVLDPGPTFDLGELCSRLAQAEGFTLACFGAVQLALEWFESN